MLPPATRSLSVTLLKSYSQHFNSPGPSYAVVKKKKKKHSKRQSTQFEETRKASEQDVAQMLELSNKEFKTMVNYDKGSSGYRAPKNAQVVEAER